MIIVHRQKVTFTISAGQASATASLSGFTNFNKMVVWGSYRVASTAAPVLSSEISVDLWASNSTTVNAARYGSTGLGAVTITVFVVEFGTDTTVQTGTWSMTNAETSDDVTISSVTLAETFALHYRQNEGEAAPEDDSDPDGRLTAVSLTTTTNLNVARAAAKGACSGHWYVVSSDTLSVQSGSFSCTGTSSTDTISTVNMADSFVVASSSTVGIRYNDECVWTIDLQDSTTVRATSGFTNADVTTYEYFVVTDSGINVQRGKITSSSASGTQAVSAVDLDNTIVHEPGGPGQVQSDVYADGNLEGRFIEYDFDSTTQISWTRDTAISSQHTWEVITFETEVAVPLITDMDDEYFSDYDVGVVADVDNAEAVQGTGKLEFANNSVYASATIKVSQTITSWSDTSITFSVNRGALSVGTVYAFLTNDTGETSVAYTITLTGTRTIKVSPGAGNITAPSNAVSANVKIWGGGAGGGAGGTSGVGGAGGGGGYVAATIAVTGSETLAYHVGGPGGPGTMDTANSGGGGGGAGRTSLYRSTTPLLISAAGGAGGGGDNSNPPAGGAGGAGGGTTGGAGGDSSDSLGAGGGTQSDGGAGGTGGAKIGGDGNSPAESPAGAGGFGADGAGSGTPSPGGGELNGGTTNGGDGGESDISAGFAGGGGGGSGYSGGGGGSSSVPNDAGGSGGGGGSSYVVAGATAVTNTQATGQTPGNTGDPDYVAGTGVGGDGGPTGAPRIGDAGGGGLLVIDWVTEDVGWLGTWKYRRKVTVENTNIDSSLTHFPLMLKLGSSVGTGPDDVTSIFDKVGANHRKIAVTKDDKVTQVYCEVVKWDAATEEAWLFVSKADLVLSSSEGTDLYFYYDTNQPDNDTYVSNSKTATPVNSVWDSNFVAVWHMSAESEYYFPAVTFSGVRQSNAGLTTADATQQQWDDAFEGMSRRLRPSSKIAMWNVTHIDDNNCLCEFTGSSADPDLTFEGADRHGSILTHFDSEGVDVYLGIELGEADPTLAIEAVLDEYGSHSCVKGVIIDLEWWGAPQWNEGNYTTQCPKATAEAWLATIQGYTAGYKLLLRHFIQGILPPTTPDFDTDIWCVCDDQGFIGLEGTGDYMIPVFQSWADKFSTHTVIFQIGYNVIWTEAGETRNDKDWWGSMDDPPAEISSTIARYVPNTGQDLGIIWVDFSLEDAEIDLLDTPSISIVRDSTSNNHDSALAQITGHGTVAGYVNGASDFEASSSDYVSFTEHADFDITANITLEATIKPESLTSWVRVFSKAHTSDVSPFTMYNLSLDNASHANFEINVAGTNYSMVCTTVMSVGNLYNYTGVYDGVDHKIYCDGTEEGTGARTGAIDTNNVAPAIARSNYGTPSNYFDGVIDEVRVSNTARTPAYVKANDYSLKDDIANWGTESVQGWPNTLHGVSNANISTVFGVALTAIEKIQEV